MQNFVTKKFIKYGLFALGAIVLVSVGWSAGRLHTPTGVGFSQLRESMFTNKNYRFINPLLGCESTVQHGGKIAPLKTKLQHLIDTSLVDKRADKISVYLDTRDGQWFGIHLDEKYSPASMTKVPTMMSILKLSETDPDLLKQKIVFDGVATSTNAGEFFKPTKLMVPHTAYTVQELLERMIIYSDNDTLPLLFHYLSDENYNEIFADLGVTLPDYANDSDNASQDFISIKAYANFFRVLYNASYLNWENSEKALDMLSKTDFAPGIKAGLPSHITVAQKFGERNFINTVDGASVYKELHNCGIVYVPKHPYLLCVMTKGQDFGALSAVIRDISKEVYDTVATFN